MPRFIREIPASMTVYDRRTGKQTHQPSSFKMLPPPKHCCQVCGVEHDEDRPHNAKSLYYQMAFNGMVGRAPTWADAVAHCDEDVQCFVENMLRAKGAWSEPPQGELPIKHHGVCDD